MRDGGRLAAAIDVIVDIEGRHRPARLALKAWGDACRYAGAKDRAFVSGLVLDVLRRRRSLAFLMGDDSRRAAALAAVRFLWDWPLDRVEAAAGAPDHGPGALQAAERIHLAGRISLAAAPDAVRGDYPDWLDSHLARAFGDERVTEGEALAQRAPVDLRVNTLKTDVDHVLRALAVFAPHAVDALPGALRIAAPHASERAAAVEATPAFEKGWFEVQDLGSQIAAASAGEISRHQVLDFCAGGGGKTLALAAAMGGVGQLYAYDADARRLAETVRRSRRAGVRNLQIRSPLEERALTSLESRMDVVFIDAPCTGSGTWRRHPDAKWRLTPTSLQQRIAEQDAILSAAAAYVKPGGRMIYATCSVLPSENEDRVADFLARTPDFALRPAAPLAGSAADSDPRFLRLTPRSAGTDGFFVATMARR